MRISDWSSDVCSSDLKALVAERADQRLKIGLVDRAGGFGKGEPAPFALVLFLPLPEFAGHRERKHLDVEHDRRAIGAPLAILIAADRRRANRPDHPRLLLGLHRGRGVAGHAGARIALRAPPAAATA